MVETVYSVLVLDSNRLEFCSHELEEVLMMIAMLIHWSTE